MILRPASERTVLYREPTMCKEPVHLILYKHWICADFVKFLMMFPVKLNKLNDNDLSKDRGKMQNSRLDGNYASKDVSRIW